MQLLDDKHRVDNSLQMTEGAIHKSETDYLENTPHGNIINGFDGYAKGAGVGGVGRGAGTARKNVAVGGGDRPFSGSSHSWKSTIVSCFFCCVFFWGCAWEGGGGEREFWLRDDGMMG